MNYITVLVFLLNCALLWAWHRSSYPTPAYVWPVRPRDPVGRIFLKEDGFPRRFTILAFFLANTISFVAFLVLTNRAALSTAPLAEHAQSSGMTSDEFNSYVMSALVISLMISGFLAIVADSIHEGNYKRLYESLKFRGIVGEEFEPRYDFFRNAAGCIPLIKKLKKEIGTGDFSEQEVELLNASIRAYYLKTPFYLLFVFTIIYTFARQSL